MALWKHCSHAIIFVLSFGSILALAKRTEEDKRQVDGGELRRRRPGLTLYIPMSILQVPAGEEGGPGGLSNLLKEKDEGD